MYLRVMVALKAGLTYRSYTNVPRDSWYFGVLFSLVNPCHVFCCRQVLYERVDGGGTFAHMHSVVEHPVLHGFVGLACKNVYDSCPSTAPCLLKPSL
jgi:hypothetical protein